MQTPETPLSNVFEAILRDGDDTNFVPKEDASFQPTDAAAGSRQKMEVLRRRLEMGLPLFHAEDRADYGGLVGAIRPRADTYSPNA